MCGILGWVGLDDGPRALARIRATLPLLAHRGPDDAGYLFHQGHPSRTQLINNEGTVTELPEQPSAGITGAVVFGHRRLAIIDPTPTGHQPMVSADGRFVLVLNGEIYNYLELRGELEALGHTFRGRSDTEVLLEAWAEWGTGALRRLVGMYAFAVLDRQGGRLVLARDCFGIKPLYLCEGLGGLCFASEIPALLALSGLPPRANPRRVYDYLDLGITDHGDQTMLAGVQSLPAAHYVDIALDRPAARTPVSYWAPDLTREADLSFPDAASRLRDLFIRSITLHMRSDVRIGTLLSGGTDSSSIVMAMRRIGGPALDIHTFSYIGGQGAISEERWIDIVNAEARAQVEKVHLQPEEWVTDADDLLTAQAEPFGSIAIYAQNRLLRRAAETGVKVVLSGQGADELLGGYRSTWALRLASLIERGHWAGAVGFVRRLKHVRGPYDPSIRRIAMLAVSHLMPIATRGAARVALGRGRRPWIAPAWCTRHGIGIARAGSRGRHGRRLARELWSSVETLGLPALLRYEDRNGMAYSVESRLPFLTPELAEFVLTLPEEYVVGPDGSTKHVFKEAMRGIVPDAILDRKDKVGFAVPMDTWVPAIPGFRGLLEFAASLPPVRRSALEPHLAGLRAGRRPGLRDSFLLWRLAGFASWARRFNVALD